MSFLFSMTKITDTFFVLPPKFYTTYTIHLANSFAGKGFSIG